MKKNVGLFLAITLTLLMLSIVSITGWVKAQPNFQETRASVLYVTISGSGTCTSWADACGLQTALAGAIAGDEIWVREGTYLPTATTNRAIFFQMKNAVAIYGGFTGTESTREERDWISNPTILSGDIGVAGVKSDNSYRVFHNSEVDVSATLNGFTIAYGNSDGSPAKYGGGMHNYKSSPTLTNITFLSNSAIYGGGMFNSDRSSPLLTNVTFASNTATSTDGLGGGMYNELYSNPTLNNVTFIDNSAGLNGGGMYSETESTPILTNVTFSGNSANMWGGGMYNYENGSPTLTNVTFSSNSAVFVGGGMTNISSNPTLTNVTFSDNSSGTNGGGMCNFDNNPILTNVTFFANSAGGIGGGMFNYKSNLNLTNAILWGNLPDQIYNDSSTPIITYSNIQGGYVGEGNIDLDALLGPLADNGGFTHTHALLPGSPAIDTGSPTVCPATDQRGITRPIDGDWDWVPRCDMGAYEYEPVIYYSYIPLILR